MWILFGLLSACTSSSVAPAAAPVTSPDPAPVPPASPAPVATVPAEPVFHFSVAVIEPEYAASMEGVSHHPDCPVPISDLRRMSLRFWGPDGFTHDGDLIANADAEAALKGAFATLFALKFPLTSVIPIEAFGGDDNASMAADNTSAFNCRELAQGGEVWSQHAYGRAVDINPLANPFVSTSGRVRPPAGVAYLDRTRTDVPGMILAGSPAMKAFYGVGWHWGGRWRFSQDLQHFSANGR